VTIKNYFSHKTTIIDTNVKVGAKTKIWHFCHISNNVSIGQNCVLGQNIFVGDNVIIGDNVKLQNNISVYEGVKIEDDVFCGPSVVFTNIKNPRSFINQKLFFSDTIIKKGATIGANTTVICGNIVGEYCLIGAGSLVSKNIKSFALAYGNPIKQIGWVNIQGQSIDLPLTSNKKIEIISNDIKYTLNYDTLEIV
jgi:UDP-2-acetamido-3-amino-2,3-dideoxy-glucuronate N-acetyltransferase